MEGTAVIFAFGHFCEEQYSTKEKDASIGLRIA